MPRFAANVSTMFAELDVPRRFDAARAAGFEAVEFLQPYRFEAAEVRRWLDDAGLELILLNTPMGDARAGERGLACLPGREAEFRAHFDQALTFATDLGAHMLHVMAGVVPDGADRAGCEATFVANLDAVAGAAAAAGVRLLLEPLNSRDVPGYLHCRSAETLRLIGMAATDNVFLQFDFYHLQIMEGDLGQRLRDHFDAIGHVQFSSVPGRNEPQYGEVNVTVLFDLLDELGYAGWVGCEYAAKTSTAEGLVWAAPYGIVAS